MKQTLLLSKLSIAFVFCLTMLNSEAQINGNFPVISVPTVSFEDDFTNANEDSGSIQISLELSEITAVDISFDLSLSAASTAQQGVDFLLPEMPIIIPSGTEGSFSFDVTVIDNMEANNEVFMAFELVNIDGAFAGDETSHVVFFQDNEEDLIVGSDELEMDFVTSYLVDGDGSAEIVAYEPISERLYVLNSSSVKVNILDFSDPQNITEINSVDMTAFGTGATSIAVLDQYVAASVDAPDFQNGNVVFLDLDGNIVNSVEVGVLPDMVTFTPDGSTLLVANEGEPSEDYTIDAEGTISKIDVSVGIENVTQGDVIELNFNSFDDQIETLRAEGVRIFGLNATVSQDVEPEYIAVSSDSQTAWVTLQENNAVAVCDLVNNEITAILPLGTKDHSLPENAIDVSDRNDEIFMANWNIRGMYMPDAIASYQVDGVTYLVTGNEGDQREYDGINEDVSVKDDEYVLDPTAYPDVDILKRNEVLGRIACSPYSGDTDGDGDFDEIHVFGARSFSIWNGSTGELVYDSGSDFETITAQDPVFGELFNASNSNNNFKNRSDNKGPEPEGVEIATIGDETYAFVGLERIGGVMVYNVSNPASPQFVTYENSRTLGEGEDEGGDLAPEGMKFIPATQSPDGNGYLVVANEESATLSVWKLARPACLASDLNGNGSVDADDLLVVLAGFGCTENCGSADLTLDGKVNLNDLLIFLSAFGSTCGIAG